MRVSFFIIIFLCAKLGRNSKKKLHVKRDISKPTNPIDIIKNVPMKLIWTVQYYN